MKDIIIIGAGPAGYEAAIRGAQLGASVALIESDVIGGTCLNRGCIPTKALYRNAEIIDVLNRADDFGINTMQYTLDLGKIRSRKDRIVTELVTGIKQLLQANSIECIYGAAMLVDKNTVKVATERGDVEVKGKYIAIATGSKPLRIPIPGADHPEVYTSDEMLELSEIPRRLLVIGGGVVGIELATIFNAFGSEVTVLDALPTILPMLDSDMSKRLTSRLKKKGIITKTKVTVDEIIYHEGLFTVKAQDKKGALCFSADRILMSVGRQPNIDGLNLDAVGIAYKKQGIDVDDNYRTNIDNIYAIGDVNGKWMLAHVASHQGIASVEKMMKKTPHTDQTLVPSCIFTFPEIATVGKGEDELKAAGVAYQVSKFMFAANGKALSLGEGEGYVKIIEVDNVIVGAHIWGPHASDLIHEAALAIRHKMTAKDIASTIHAHPTLSEAFVEAVMGLKGQAIHMLPKKMR